MSRLSRSSVLSVLVVAVTLACSDGTGPVGTRPITLNLCADAPTWVAYLNEGGQWRRLSGAGTFSFDATPKVVLATGDGESGYSYVSLFFGTSEQLESLSCGSDLFGAKSASGTVQGLTEAQTAVISLGLSTGYVASAYPDYSLYGLPDGSLDLIASRVDQSSFSVDRMIIRRGLSLADGATIPALDFESSESFAPVVSNLTLTGHPSGTLPYVTGSFRTANGTEHSVINFLGCGTTLCSSVLPIHEVPASRLLATDMHEIEAEVLDFTGSASRSIVHFYQAPGDKTLAFGPEPATPSWSAAATSPHLLPRIQMARQDAYNTFLFAGIDQTTQQGSRSYFIVATKDYFGDGNPQTWDITIPDLSQVQGFQSSWNLQPGTYDWSVQVLDASFDVATGALPPGGATFRAAARYSPSFMKLAPGKQTFLRSRLLPDYQRMMVK